MVPPPADLGNGDLPLHELPLYVLDEVAPRRSRADLRARASPEQRPATPPTPARPQAPPPVAVVPAAGSISSRTEIRFTRLVMQPFDRCTQAIDQWRHQHGTAGVMMVGGSRLSDAADRPAMLAPYRLRVDLRSTLLAWSIPMDLEVIPRYSYATIVVLLPRHRVVLLRRYFRAGHDLLDTIVAVIENEAEPSSR